MDLIFVCDARPTESDPNNSKVAAELGPLEWLTRVGLVKDVLRAFEDYAAPRRTARPRAQRA